MTFCLFGQLACALGLLSCLLGGNAAKGVTARECGAVAWAQEGAIVASASLCAGTGDVHVESDGCLQVAALSLLADFCVAASVFVSFLSVLRARSHLTVFG